jgi:hypothetical protein
MCSLYFFHFVKEQSSLKKPEANPVHPARQDLLLVSCIKVIGGG